MGVIGAIRNEFSKIPTVRERVVQLQAMLLSLNANLVAQHIKGVDNIVSETISRLDIGDCFQFNIHLLNDISQYVGFPTIDRFATNANKITWRFNSYFAEENSEGIDAFAQCNWDAELNFCYPPFNQICRLLNFIMYSHPHA